MLQTRATLGDLTGTLDGGGALTGDLNASSFSGTGIDIRVGFRALVTKRLEIEGFIRRHPFDDVDTTITSTYVLKSQIKASLGVAYHVTKHIRLGASYQFANKNPGLLNIGVRYSF